MFAITELSADECRFPVTSDRPFLFCGEPVRDATVSYCPTHCAVCFTGKIGKAWQALAGMIDATELNVVTSTPRDDRQADMVEELRDAK